MSTRVLTAHVPEELAERVDELAERLERSRGWIVKQALTDWVALEDERRQLTLEALADVNSGRVVEHDSMISWAAEPGADDKR